jgi:hypothetical protein
VPSSGVIKVDSLEAFHGYVSYSAVADNNELLVQRVSNWVRFIDGKPSMVIDEAGSPVRTLERCLWIPNQPGSKFRLFFIGNYKDFVEWLNGNLEYYRST